MERLKLIVKSRGFIKASIALIAAVLAGCGYAVSPELQTAIEVALVSIAQ